ncbi:MAG: hypothetical protein AAFQ82_07200, partial [Myxococcota bacterium]
MAELTQKQFERALDRVSDSGQYVFTREQLRIAACAVRAKKRPSFGVIVFTACGACLPLFMVYPQGAVAFVIPAFLTLKRLLFRPVSAHDIDACIRSLPARPEGLVESTTLSEPPPDFAEDDIYDYGVERVIVVDRNIAVDLMVRNNIHTDHRAVVISQTGYPTYLIPRVQRILKERPDLPVYLLHDSDRSTHDMVEEAVRAGLPLDENRVIDLGLDHAFSRRIDRSALGLSDKRLRVDQLLPAQTRTLLDLSLVHGITFGEALRRKDSGTKRISGLVPFVLAGAERQNASQCQR